MNKKTLLVLGIIFALAVGGFMAHNEVSAKVKEQKVKLKNKNRVCEYAVPPSGCTWTNITPYPECGGTLSCSGAL
jgi:predicted small secreted protein